MKAAFFLNACGLSVVQEIFVGDKIEPAVLKEIAYHLTHSLRHQALSPISLGEHTADFTSPVLRKLRKLFLDVNISVCRSKIYHFKKQHKVVY